MIWPCCYLGPFYFSGEKGEANSWLSFLWQEQPHLESRQFCLPLKLQLRRLQARVTSHSHPFSIVFPSIVSKWKSRSLSNVQGSSSVSMASQRNPVSVMSPCETLSITGWTSRICWLLHILPCSCRRLATYWLPKICPPTLRATKHWEIEIKGLQNAACQLSSPCVASDTST